MMKAQYRSTSFFRNAMYTFGAVCIALNVHNIRCTLRRLTYRSMQEDQIVSYAIPLSESKPTIVVDTEPVVIDPISAEPKKKKPDDKKPNDWPPVSQLEVLIASSKSSDARSKRGAPRLVVAASNADYVDFADNFANSLLRLNVTNFVLVPLDMKAFEILSQAYPEHTLPTMPGLENHPDGVASFGSSVFKTLTSSRPVFLQHFLKKGYAVLYNDIDMVWRKNAWDVIDQRDKSNNLDRMLWKDGQYQICSCILYLLPTPDSILLMKQWEDEITSESHQNNPKAFDQNAFAVVARERHYPLRGGVVAKTQVFLNDNQFPAGKHFSWNVTKPANKEAVIIHNNWIVSKLAKKARFELAGLWYPSGRIVTSDA
jgi:rhamnogalacturonan II specific xylosyltransferase